MSSSSGSETTTWCDNKSWTSLWSGYVLCGGSCPGIRKIEADCPACGSGPAPIEGHFIERDGKRVAAAVFMGAEGRYEDYIYLQMLQREWDRPVKEFDVFSHVAGAERPSARAALVLLFWGYFETRIERLLRTAMRDLPERVLEDQLRRYSGVAARMGTLYKIFFASTYLDDLRELGHAHVADLLADIHERRNAFTHGNRNQSATTQSLVSSRALRMSMKLGLRSTIDGFEKGLLISSGALGQNGEHERYRAALSERRGYTRGRFRDRGIR